MAPSGWRTRTGQTDTTCEPFDGESQSIYNEPVEQAPTGSLFEEAAPVSEPAKPGKGHGKGGSKK